MARHCARTLSMLVVLGNVLAADETMKHYHNGKLPKYELSAPSIMLSAGDEEVLNKGKALMQVIMQPDGKRRLIMVRDVATPAWVVMDRILDFPAYPRMVKGCDALVPYKDTREARPHLVMVMVMGPHRGARTRTRLPRLPGRRTLAPPLLAQARGRGVRVMRAKYEISPSP